MNMSPARVRAIARKEFRDYRRNGVQRLLGLRSSRGRR
jgi:hypothetical protein